MATKKNGAGKQKYDTIVYDDSNHFIRMPKDAVKPGAKKTKRK